MPPSKADDQTREVLGATFLQLALEKPNDTTPQDQLERRYRTAVEELQQVVDNRKAAARIEAVTLLGRLIAMYQKSCKSAFLPPAGAAVQTLLARIEDQGEVVPLRLEAMEQWSLFRLVDRSRAPSGGAAAPGPRAVAGTDELHASASWIAALGRCLKDPAPEIRTRALLLMVGSFKDPLGDPACRKAWQKAVPTLAEAARSEDANVRTGALAMLSMLGPEAGQALEPLRGTGPRHAGSARSAPGPSRRSSRSRASTH